MRRLLALGVVTLALVGAPAASAREVTVATATEAWYATLPSLTAPPAGTLHVGVTAGLEDSRTYLSLDLGAVPADADVSSGLLTLPIDAADSQAPESAVIDVCLAPEPGPSVEGSADAPPEADCTVTARAVHAGDAFTVDLAPFLPRLRDAGLALVPAPEAGASWHVALWARTSESPEARPITASLTVADDEPAVVAPPPAPAEPAGDEVASAPLFSGEGTGFGEPQTPPLPTAPEPVEVEVGRPSLGAAPPLPSAPTRYADSLVFALPLVLLALVGYFGSALTRPIVLTPVTPAAGQPSPRRARLRALAARERRAGG